MGENRTLFQEGEANEWFRRNRNALEDTIIKNSPISILSDWLKPFKSEINEIIEIGCGSGHRLNQLSKELEANGYGVDPSSEAVSYIEKNFPSLETKVGFADNLESSKKYDLVHLGFFLYLVDRELFLRCVSEVDRSVKFGGFLSIIDFEPPFPYSNTYSHLSNIYSHKQNNSDVFVASGLYSIINKFQFSDKKLYFDKVIDERCSLTLLYKETEIFKGTP